MSLVAYNSSDDGSDSEGEKEAEAPDSDASSNQAANARHAELVAKTEDIISESETELGESDGNSLEEGERNRNINILLKALPKAKEVNSSVLEEDDVLEEEVRPKASQMVDVPERPRKKAKLRVKISVPALPGTKVKRRQYSFADLTAAYLRAKEGGISIRKAARMYGVPESTIRHRLSGYTDPDCIRSGPAPVLSQAEEKLIAEHLKFTSSVGYGYNRSDIMKIGTEFASSLGLRERDQPLTLGWYDCFMHRWPGMDLMKPRGLKLQWAKATSAKCVNTYFTELKKILKKNSLARRPDRVFMVDERAFSISQASPYVVPVPDSKADSRTDSSRYNISVIGCGSANGEQVPPYFVFQGTRMRQDLLDGCSEGAAGDVSETGLCNGSVLLKYLHSHFIKFMPDRSEADPILLLYDGHKSHLFQHAFQWAIENHIILFVMPAFTSYLLRSGECGCLGLLESSFIKECEKFKRTQNREGLTRPNVASLGCRAYTPALSVDNLKAAFKTPGIFPCNPAAIELNHFQKSKPFKSVIVEERYSSPEDTEESYFEEEVPRKRKKRKAQNRTHVSV